jgi:uncharacterized protein (TIGR03067 family)
MKRTILAIAAVGILVAAVGADDAGKKDLDKMQGEWAAVDMIRDGNKISADSAQAYFRSVQGESYAVSRYRKVQGKGTFKLDVSQTPRHIDATPDMPAGAKTLKGIYAWDGEKLKMNFGSPGGDRPKDFTCPEGSKQAYTVWERENK